MIAGVSNLASAVPNALLPELRAGHLGVRLAHGDDELDAVQSLRYRIFYQEMGAKEGVTGAAAQGRDRDEFDEVADHLIVVDHSAIQSSRSIVATYRLLRSDAAAKIGQFYSEAEYDIRCIREYKGQVLELGRSCVDSSYRNRAAMQLLWRGIAAYVFNHSIDLMFGCASLPGIKPDALSEELSYLYYNHLAPAPICPRALDDRYVEMRRIAPLEVDNRRALGLLPPLIKGYLRLGGFVGDGAVIDSQFNTTDVAIVVKTDLVTDKYYRHYERQVRSGVE